jgi:hypothetical protein
MLDKFLNQIRAAKVREAEDAAKEAVAKINKVVEDELARMRATVKDIEDDRKRRLEERMKQDLSGDPGLAVISRGFKYAEELRDQQKSYVDDLLALTRETGPEMFNLQRAQLEFWYQDQRAMARGNAARLLVTDQQYALRKKAIDTAEMQWAKMTAAQQRKAKEDAVMGALGAMSQLFPKVKAFAIAQAIISTYQAAAAAMQGPPPMPWAAVNVAAHSGSVWSGNHRQALVSGIAVIDRGSGRCVAALSRLILRQLLHLLRTAGGNAGIGLTLLDDDGLRHLVLLDTVENILVVVRRRVLRQRGWAGKKRQHREC